MDADRRILAAVTRRGRRLLTLAEILEEGVTYAQVVVRVAGGRWQRVHDGVYLIGAGALSWEEKQLAATLAAGDTAASAFRAAGLLLGIGDYGRSLVEISITHDAKAKLSGVKVHRTRRLTAVTTVRGIPCTGPEETLLDLAAVLGPRLLHQALTTAWRKQLTTPTKVLAHVERYGGRGVKGTTQLREIASLYDACKRGPGSEAEADFVWELLERIEKAGIERPELQAVIDVDRGRRKLTVDFLWPGRTKVIEMVGLEAHGDYFRHDEDAHRSLLIRNAGFKLRELTPRMIRERPDQTIRECVEFLRLPALE